MMNSLFLVYTLMFKSPVENSPGNNKVLFCYHTGVNLGQSTDVRKKRPDYRWQQSTCPVRKKRTEEMWNEK